VSGRDDDERLVWSSERGDLRGPRQRERSSGRGPAPIANPRGPGGRDGVHAARPNAPSGASDGVARVRRETAGRGGKTVTAVHGLHLPEQRLRELASELKRLCGTGGSVKDGVIEIQGEHVDKVLDALRSRGLEAKRAGG
jgi:translation initiation factor 1